MHGCSVDDIAAAVDELALLHGPRWGDPTLLDLEWIRKPSPEAGAGDGGAHHLGGRVVPRATTPIGSSDDTLALVDRMCRPRTTSSSPHRPSRGRSCTVTSGPTTCCSAATRVVVVDWQTVGVGAGPADLAYLLGASLLPEVRRVHEDALVDRYVAGLARPGRRPRIATTCGRMYRRYAFGGLIMAIVAQALVRAHRPGRRDVHHDGRPPQPARRSTSTASPSSELRLLCGGGGVGATDARAHPHPTATYRFQLTPSFAFDRATAQLDRLQRLGVSHVYLSPVTEAVPGSTHGYDVVDHSQVQDELGGIDGLTAFARRVRRARHGRRHRPRAEPHRRRPPELNARWWAMLRDGRASDPAAVVRRRLGRGRRSGDPPGARRAARRRRRRPHDRRRRAAPRCAAVAVAPRNRVVVADGHPRPPALPPAVVAGAGAQRAAVLHHRRPRGRPRRGSGRRRSGRQRATTARRPRGRSPASASTTSTGSPIRSATWRGCGARIGDRWLLVEKILAADETLPGRGPWRARRGTSTPPCSSTPCSTARAGPRSGALGRDHRRRPAVPGVGVGGRRGAGYGGLRPDLQRAARTRGLADTVPVAELSVHLQRYRTVPAPTRRDAGARRGVGGHDADAAGHWRPRSNGSPRRSTHRASGGRLLAAATGRPATAKDVEDCAFLALTCRWRHSARSAGTPAGPGVDPLGDVARPPRRSAEPVAADDACGHDPRPH